LLLFLTNSIEQIFQEPFYSEEIILSTVELVSNAIEMFPSSQEWVINNVKIYDICAKLMFQMDSLPVAGRTCLFLSHLLANNKAAQALFLTDEMAKCLVFLLNFNELVNKCDPDMPMDTL
jgi:hypothetical protein